MFVAGATRAFVFPGCATSTFSSEPEVSVVSTPNAGGSASVEITPSALGAWALTINANGSTQTREILTDEEFDLDAGYVVRYPDRIDFSARTVTPSGRLLVGTTLEEFTVYGVDGGLEQTIAANLAAYSRPMAWMGDALLTITPQAPRIERWVETPAGLVSSGTLDATGNSYCVFCRIEGDRLISAFGSDLVASVWDGGVVVSKEVVTTKLALSEPFELLLNEGPEKVWATDFCSYEPGCTSTVCAAIQTCIGNRGHSRLLYANDQHALVSNGAGQVLQLWELPLSNRKELHARSGGSRTTTPSREDPIAVSGAEAVIH